MNKRTKRAALALACGVFAVACTSDADPAGQASPSPSATSTANPAQLPGTRGEVLARGVVRCGVAGDRVGFSLGGPDATMQGLDADVCRALAAAVLGEATKVDFVVLSEQEQFTALAAGTVDVLLGVRAGATADGVEAVTFAPPTFYDGQGVMVLETSEVQSLADLEGQIVCTFVGSATDLDTSGALADRGISVTPLPFPDANRLMPAFENGECGAATADRSLLAALRSEANSAIRILPVTVSRRPLGPATREGDAQWSQIVTWTVYGTLLAEELGISSSNLATFLESPDPDVQRLLGLTTDGGSIFDAGLGLPDEWAQHVIGQVGNYGEIYTRNLGPGTTLDLVRAGSVNALWSGGGQHYPWPYR